MAHRAVSYSVDVRETVVMQPAPFRLNVAVAPAGMLMLAHEQQRAWEQLGALGATAVPTKTNGGQ